MGGDCHIHTERLTHSVHITAQTNLQLHLSICKINKSKYEHLGESGEIFPEKMFPFDMDILGCSGSIGGNSSLTQNTMAILSALFSRSYNYSKARGFDI